jgi:hypothetical protein
LSINIFSLLKNSKLRSFGYYQVVNSTEQILYGRNLVNKILEKCKGISKTVRQKVKRLTEYKAGAASSSDFEFIQQPKILNEK